LFRNGEAPAGWGVLVEMNDSLELARKPAWHDNPEEARVRLLQRIAVAGTRQFNRAFGITRGEIVPPSGSGGLA
jgi:hypothetical protein